ncbi:hypothetical protein VTK56DRAFT_3781 [Thermocarpiscus australiensis]
MAATRGANAALQKDAPIAAATAKSKPKREKQQGILPDARLSDIKRGSAQLKQHIAHEKASQVGTEDSINPSAIRWMEHMIRVIEEHKASKGSPEELLKEMEESYERITGQ